MLPFQKAISSVGAIKAPLKTGRVDLLNALDHVLAEDIISDSDIPPYNRSAMDGFACRKEDLQNILEVIEEIPAGKVPLRTIGENQCSRIMTGGSVPEGADFVIQLEHVEETGTGFIKRIIESPNNNISLKGEDIHKGDTVLQKGELIHPQHIAILATAGAATPLVFKTPSLAVISTGSELVEPWEIPGPSQIRNSNAWQLMAQSAAVGYNPDYLGIFGDNEAALTGIISEAASNYDILLISGGVSVGDYDFIPKVLINLGAEIFFHGLNAKPGRHMLFAGIGDTLIFGLPGNPVSSYVQFELIIKPHLLNRKGLPFRNEFKKVPIESGYSRKKAGTLSFVPGRMTETGTVLPLEYHGSAHIHAYRMADCIIEIPENTRNINKGDLVNVRPL